MILSDMNIPLRVRRRLPSLSSSMPFLIEGAAMLRQYCHSSVPNSSFNFVSESPWLVRMEVMIHSLYRVVVSRISVS